MGLLVLFDLACLCAILGPKVIIYMVLKTGLVWISSKVGGVLGVWGLLGIEMLACNLPAFNNAQVISLLNFLRTMLHLIAYTDELPFHF